MTINVTLIAYPDGSTIHIKDADQEDIRKANKGWRDSLSDNARERHKEANTMGGAVMLRMLEEDYKAIPATNHPGIMALVQGVHEHD